MLQLVGEIPELKRKWMAGGGACPHVCIPMDGQIVGVNEPFITPLGDEVMYGGAHPNCRCSQIPWKSDWPTLIG
jgi:hypothetical protein